MSEVAFAIVKQQPVLQCGVIRFVVIVSAAYQVQVQIIVVIDVDKVCIRVGEFATVIRLEELLRFNKRTRRRLKIEPSRIVLCPTHIHVVKAVAIDVARSHHRTTVSEHREQQGLSLKIVEPIFYMGIEDLSVDTSKERFRVSVFVLRRVSGFGRLSDYQKLVGVNRTFYGADAVGPDDNDGVSIFMAAQTYMYFIRHA